MVIPARWWIIGAIGVADVVLNLGRDIAIAGAAGPAAVLALLLVLRAVYGRLRPDRRIAALAGSAVEIIVYTQVAALLSYHAVIVGPPLIDAALAQADALMRFDWPAVFHWVHGRPLLQGVLEALYQSLIPQVIVVLGVLHFRGRHRQAEEFVAAFIGTSLACIAISALLPAESAWVYFDVTDRIHPYHLEQFSALRADALREIDLRHVEGLITFPSFHAALAAILAYAARGVRLLFPLMLVANAGVVLATPTQGGHYLVDVLCGLAVAAMVVMLLRRRQAAIPAGADTMRADPVYATASSRQGR